MVNNRNNRCKRCKGNILVEDGIGKCLQCGRESTNNHLRHQYIEEHIEEILADLKELKGPRTRKKWRISPSTLWNIQRQRRQGNGSKEEAPVITLINLTPPVCSLCDNGATGDSLPSFLDTPKGRLYLCGGCLKGIKKVFDAFGIEYRISEAPIDNFNLPGGGPDNPTRQRQSSRAVPCPQKL